MGSDERTGAPGGRNRGSSRPARAARRGAALALVGLLAAAAAALAAAHLRGGAPYTGQNGECSSGVPGTTCVFRFRASHDGLSLRFVGKTVIDTWICHGGGGEALLGGEVKGATPIPLVKVRPQGKLYGSLSYTFGPTQGSPIHYEVTVTGHLAKAGGTAVITFHNTSHSSSGTFGCATRPVTLTEG